MKLVSSSLRLFGVDSRRHRRGSSGTNGPSDDRRTLLASADCSTTSHFFHTRATRLLVTRL